MTNLALAPANTIRLILLLFARIFPRHFHTHPFLSGQIKSDRIKSNLEIRRHTSVLLSAVLYCVVIVGGKRIDDSLILFFSFPSFSRWRYDSPCVPGKRRCRRWDYMKWRRRQICFGIRPVGRFRDRFYLSPSPRSFSYSFFTPSVHQGILAHPLIYQHFLHSHSFLVARLSFSCYSFPFGISFHFR